MPSRYLIEEVNESEAAGDVRLFVLGEVDALDRPVAQRNSFTLAGATSL